MNRNWKFICCMLAVFGFSRISLAITFGDGCEIIGDLSEQPGSQTFSQMLDYLVTRGARLSEAALEGVRDSKEFVNPIDSENHGLSPIDATVFGSVFESLSTISGPEWQKVRLHAKSLLEKSSSSKAQRLDSKDRTKSIFHVGNIQQLKGRSPVNNEGLAFELEGKPWLAYSASSSFVLVDAANGKSDAIEFPDKRANFGRSNPVFGVRHGKEVLIFPEEKSVWNLKDRRWENWGRPYRFADALQSQKMAGTETGPLLYAPQKGQSALVWSEKYAELKVFFPPEKYRSLRAPFTRTKHFPVRLPEDHPGYLNGSVPRISHPFATSYQGQLVVGLIDTNYDRAFLLRPGTENAFAATRLPFTVRSHWPEWGRQKRQIQFSDLAGDPVIAYASPGNGMIIHHPFDTEKDGKPIPLLFGETPNVVPFQIEEKPYLFVSAADRAHVVGLEEHRVVSSISTAAKITTRPQSFEWKGEKFFIWGDKSGAVTVATGADTIVVLSKQKVVEDKIKLVTPYLTSSGPKALVVSQDGRTNLVDLTTAD